MNAPQPDVVPPSGAAPTDSSRPMAEHTPAQVRARRSTARRVLTIVTTTLATALLILAVAVAVVPRVMGGAALTVLSGSMEPAISVGDMVVSVPQERYELDDVVTFQPVSGDPTLVTHRVVGVTIGPGGPSYLTRGDANGADDDPIVQEQVMGKVIYTIPYVGYLSQAVGEHRSTVVTVIAVALLGYGAVALLVPARYLSRRSQPTSDSARRPSRSTPRVTRHRKGPDA
ncbi:signal peptidase I [Serinibacter salmoneus]|uniref:Signal peptidase I n=1 Tax=Serinibacter salmoneus TaxID=556530 RepID=A0A2A9CZM3_9MICO|nr:signal peptidase I [Serinibacter salmoneus]PFG19050.1 signal peptidase [Serinibacter salmoneus]